MYQVFYYFGASEREISSADPVRVSVESLLDELIPALSNQDDYIGLLDSEGNILQLSLDDDRGFWVELPAPDERRSYGRSMIASELTELLHRLPAQLELSRFAGFEPRPWGSANSEM